MSPPRAGVISLIDKPSISWPRTAAIFGMAVAACVIDLVSKELVFARLSEGVENRSWVTLVTLGAPGTMEPVPGFHLDIAFSRDESGRVVPFVNHGALFGMGGSQWWGNAFFTIISLAAAVGIAIWVALMRKPPEWILAVALGLILGGTVGNLHDRAIHGGVRDFLHWNYLFDWPVFNMADVFLVTGAGLLLLHVSLMPGEAAAAAKEPSTGVSP